MKAVKKIPVPPTTPNPPIGSITAYAGPRMSADAENQIGWMICDGRSLETGKYSELFKAIGTSWGGDAVDKFNIPDLQGLFLRGVDGDAGRDPEKGDRIAMKAGGHSMNQVGSYQTDRFAAHGHSVVDPGHIHPIHDEGHKHDIHWGIDVELGDQVHERANKEGDARKPQTYKSTTGIQIRSAATGIAVQPVGGPESRPKNAYVYFLIRFK
jgi:hypothetical protein